MTQFAVSTTSEHSIYASLELSKNSWLLAIQACTLFMNPSRIRKVAAALKPATLLAFHRAMKERKYPEKNSQRLLRRSHWPIMRLRSRNLPSAKFRATPSRHATRCASVC